MPSFAFLLIHLWSTLFFTPQFVSYGFGNSGFTPTWTLIKDNYAVFCSAAQTCSVAIQAVGSQAGKHVLIVSIQTFDSSATSISSATATGGTQTLCTSSACAAQAASDYNTDSAAIIGVTAGTSTVALGLSVTQSFGFNVNVREYTWSGTTVAYDTGAHATSSSCSSCAGPTASLGGVNDLVMQTAYGANDISAISGCYSSSVSGLTTQYIDAACPDVSSYTQPTYTQPTAGPASMSAIALKGS